ncbi:ROK family protein [Pelosinus sp. sgz500959]|uniref:ROK family protein n=1 Tax=Pelosinus sp. sgz500959 TaxID=3242472 RepID=UPI00366AA836
MKTADQLLVKQINKMLVLNTIYKEKPISRAEIAKRTGLNKSTVSALVDELLSEGLTLEIGTGESQGGRKPINLSINKEIGSVIGIDLGVNYILSILTNFAGQIIWEKRITIKNIIDSPQQKIHDLFELIKETIEHAPETRRGIIGMGIGVPGMVNYDHGHVLSAPNLLWENIKLKDLVEEEFQIPTLIDNEANAGAIGEKWFGLGKKASELVYVSAGTGIGAGIVINNELYRGSRGLAGEIGHMTVDVHGIRCTCGNVGCWEEYASEKALIRYFKDHATQYPDSILLSKSSSEYIDNLNIFQIIDAATKGDQLAIEGFKNIGYYLGVGVSNLINAFNPECVVIGNALPLVGDVLMDELRNEVARRCFSSKYSNIKISSSELYMNACALGAVALVISRIYASPVSR